VFLLDSLLIGGLRFVLDKVAAAVDTEMNDDTALRERLLEAQMRYELGELSDAEYADTERELLDRLREIKRRRQGDTVTMDPNRYKVSGVESVNTVFDED
jgi:gas vesicle protein GvpG